MTPTEAALLQAAEALEVLSIQIALKPYAEMTRDFQARIQEVTLAVRTAALAAPPHGKDAGELKTCEPDCDPFSGHTFRCMEAQRDALQDLIHTAANTLDIVASSPQDFVTHVLLLREERDELKARLTEALAEITGVAKFLETCGQRSNENAFEFVQRLVAERRALQEEIAGLKARLPVVLPKAPPHHSPDRAACPFIAGGFCDCPPEATRD